MEKVSVGVKIPKTLKQPVSMRGVGLHTGVEVEMRLVPAPPGSGIKFQRTDLPGKPLIPASVHNVQATQRCTTIGVGDALVHTVEHVMAALSAYSIDNVVVELSACEPPIAGGDARLFVEKIEEAGIEEQEGEIPIMGLSRPVVFSEGASHVVAMPSDEFRISYTIHYPQVPVIRSQYFSIVVDSDAFKRELAPCRTFALQEEIAPLIEAGLIKGGNLDSAVLIDGDQVVNKDGLRFPDEPVRHKILDMIGDLALIGFPLRAHVMAVCCGHRANVELGKRIVNEYE